MRLAALSFSALAIIAFPGTAAAGGANSETARSIAIKTIQLQDRDGDGRISLKENAGAALVMFNAIDADRSQRVSATELVQVTLKDAAALRISTTPGQAKAMVAARFQMMDIDGDGSISLPEILAVSQTVFDTADTDGDGYVTAEEMVALSLDGDAN